MSVMQSKVFKAATALSRHDDDVTSIKSDLSIIKWMMGFVLAFQVATFARMFLH